MSVYVVRAFMRMREELTTGTVILKRLAQIDKKLLEHDVVLQDVVEKLLPLLNPPPEESRSAGSGFTRTLDSPPLPARRLSPAHDIAAFRLLPLPKPESRSRPPLAPLRSPAWGFFLIAETRSMIDRENSNYHKRVPQLRMVYYAHTAEDENGRPLPESSGRWQPLSAHLRNVAELAAEFAAPLGLSTEAELAGLLHDLGKYAARFQARLHDHSIHGINHWAAGAVHALNQLRSALVAYSVDGHHTGLPAAGDLAQIRQRASLVELWRQHTGCPEPIAELLARFAADGLVLPPAPPAPGKDHFASALRARFLFSCLVDADFLDTERHFDPEAAKQRSVPSLRPEQSLDRLFAALAEKPADGPVNRLRRQLLADCLAASGKPSGLFTLTAPTGSGKTLSSLAFALKHIAAHNDALTPTDPRRLRRVIVVIPYTSIIEQTAQVYRELFEQAFGPDYVLEHHSAVAPREHSGEREQDAEDERLRRARLASENWASPVVVTTSVQFFESLFAHKPGDCRKLHNIVRSVVLFDEVQTLPPRLVPSLLSAVRLLTQEPYGVTAVFMTATQPAFTSAKTALPYGWEPMEISSNPGAMADALCRTRIELPASDTRLPWPTLAAQLCAHPQALCVVNTTAHARDLFRQLPPENRFHLSARLCPAHRQEKLQLIRERLAAGAPCRLVSTQLIEAGVDVDFPVAFRALGPLDSIIQTAGRCNREGRSAEPRPVIVFRPEDNATPPGAYRTAAALTESFLARHPDAPLHRPDFYAAYFAELYSLLGRESAETDPVFAASKSFDFPKAAAECRLVGEETRAVLVRWGEGERLIEKLSREKHLSPEEWRRVQRFSVNLYQGEFLRAQANGYIAETVEGVWFWNSKYDSNLGACHAEGSDFCL
jgi:CRISPR-associated helicase Cas3/CRISPR-associated endonuclease Cas3-HD